MPRIVPRMSSLINIIIPSSSTPHLNIQSILTNSHHTIDLPYLTEYLLCKLIKMYPCFASKINMSKQYQDISPSLLPLQNPQESNQHCRICYLSVLPLISICQCSGSLQFIHEECAIEWIAQKMQTEDIITLPRCELCRQEYTASLTVGKKELNLEILLGNIRGMEVGEVMRSLGYLAGSIGAVCILLLLLYSVGVSFLGDNASSKGAQLPLISIKTVLTQLFFPLAFLQTAYLHFLKLFPLWRQAQVQLVELVLTPRLILKG